MSFGLWRGMPLALALGTTLTLGLALASASTANAMDDTHVMPGWVPAYDFTTGQQYQAPPIPYGHYAKDIGEDLHRKWGCANCGLHGLLGGGHGHSGGGLGHGHSGDGLGCADGNCGSTGGCGHGWFGKGGGGPCSQGVGCGYLGKHHGSSPCGTVMATGQAPSGQSMARPSGQSLCGQSGCTIGGKHGHRSSRLACGSCGGRGCGACGGSGYDGGCGQPGCGIGHGHGTGCGLCGGRGCASCLSGLKNAMAGKLAGMLHKPKIKWFLGAGGPVPITPGYVPYIVTTRSPREFFAFAPMNPNAP